VTSSITLMARDGDWTGVFTLRPDGHTSHGQKKGPLARNHARDLPAEEVAEVFRLAALPPDVPAGPRGGTEGTVTLTIQDEGGGRRQFAWAVGARPADARLLRLVEAVEAVRDRALGR
jgi:hypothetical protein